MIQTSPDGPRSTRSTRPANAGSPPSAFTLKRSSTASTRYAPGSFARADSHARNASTADSISLRWSWKRPGSPTGFSRENRAKASPAVQEIPVGAHRQLFQRGPTLDGRRGKDGPRTRKERPSLPPRSPLREDPRHAVPRYLPVPPVREDAVAPAPQGRLPPPPAPPPPARPPP